MKNRLQQFGGLFFSILIVASAAFSEEPQTTQRPKVGLVLAGGGALGFAHVGVLRVLEENRVPVDMIAGTSMGAIVGAAYAAGVSLDEMEDVLSNTDWEDLFDEEPPRRELLYRLKPGRDREIFGDAKLSVDDGGLVLPTGIVEGQSVLPLLQRLYKQVPNPIAFDELPIPFRGVTADVETGKPYIPEGGDLSRVVRASMSVPGAFSPMEIDGKLLVDGGIANNLPVDQVLSMGADVLIVVELYADLKTRKELNSLFAISGQMISLLLAQNSALQIKLMRPKDILIAPDLTGYGSTDFAKGKELMVLGEETARKTAAKLRALSLSPVEYAEYQAQRSLSAEQKKIEFIRIENNSDAPDELIMRELEVKVGDDFNTSTIDADVESLYNTGVFQKVEYAFKEEDGRRGLVLSVKGRKWSKEFMRLGISIEDDFEGESTYRLALNYRLSQLNTYGGYLDTQFEIGRNPRAYAEFFQPFGKGSPYYIAPEVEFVRGDLLVLDGNETIAEYERRVFQGGLKLGRELGRIGDLSIGYRHGSGDFERRIGQPDLPDFDYDIGDAFAGLVLDSRDTPDFPTSGFSAGLVYQNSLEDLGAEDDFDWIAGGVTLPLTWGRNTLTLNTDFAETFEDRPIERSFSLGGFADISGFQRDSLLASDYVVGRAYFYRRFSEIKIPFVGLGFYAGGSLEVSHLQVDLPGVKDPGSIFSGSVFIGADTPLVPVYFAVGVSDQDQNAVYLTLGRLSANRGY